MRKTLLTTLALTFLLGGCAWGIKLDHAGHQVRTDWNGDMSVCQRLGKVTVSVADSVGPFDRNDIKVRDELEVMARNEAGTMQGADTVHPLTEPVGGSQAWGVYACKGAVTAPATASSQTAPARTFPINSDSGPLL